MSHIVPFSAPVSSGKLLGLIVNQFFRVAHPSCWTLFYKLYLKLYTDTRYLYVKKFLFTSAKLDDVRNRSLIVWRIKKELISIHSKTHAYVLELWEPHVTKPSLLLECRVFFIIYYLTELWLKFRSWHYWYRFNRILDIRLKEKPL